MWVLRSRNLELSGLRDMISLPSYVKILSLAVGGCGLGLCPPLLRSTRYRPHSRGFSSMVHLCIDRRLHQGSGS